MLMPLFFSRQIIKCHQLVKRRVISIKKNTLYSCKMPQSKQKITPQSKSQFKIQQIETIMRLQESMQTSLRNSPLKAKNISKNQLNTILTLPQTSRKTRELSSKISSDRNNLSKVKDNQKPIENGPSSNFNRNQNDRIKFYRDKYHNQNSFVSKQSKSKVSERIFQFDHCQEWAYVNSEGASLHKLNDKQLNKSLKDSSHRILNQNDSNTIKMKTKTDSKAKQDKVKRYFDPTKQTNRKQSESNSLTNYQITRQQTKQNKKNDIVSGSKETATNKASQNNTSQQREIIQAQRKRLGDSEKKQQIYDRIATERESRISALNEQLKRHKKQIQFQQWKIQQQQEQLKVCRQYLEPHLNNFNLQSTHYQKLTEQIKKYFINDGKGNYYLQPSPTNQDSKSHNQEENTDKQKMNFKIPKTHCRVNALTFMDAQNFNINLDNFTHSKIDKEKIDLRNSDAWKQKSNNALKQELEEAYRSIKQLERVNRYREEELELLRKENQSLKYTTNLQRELLKESNRQSRYRELHAMCAEELFTVKQNYDAIHAKQKEQGASIIKLKHKISMMSSLIGRGTLTEIKSDSKAQFQLFKAELAKTDCYLETVVVPDSQASIALSPAESKLKEDLQKSIGSGNIGSCNAGPNSLRSAASIKQTVLKRFPMPSYLCFHQENSLLFYMRESKQELIKPEFVLLMRTILDAKYVDLRLHKQNSKKFAEFTYSFLQSYKLLANKKLYFNVRNVASWQQEMVKINFLMNLFDKRISSLPEICTVRQFLVDNPSQDEVAFYLICRDKLLQGPQQENYINCSDLNTLVSYAHARKITMLLLTNYNRKLKDLVFFHLDCKKIIKNKLLLIDPAYVLRLLLQIYRKSKTKKILKLQVIFRDISEFNGVPVMKFSHFRELIEKNYSFLSKSQICWMYRKTISLCQSNSTAKHSEKPQSDPLNQLRFSLECNSEATQIDELGSRIGLSNKGLKSVTDSPQTDDRGYLSKEKRPKIVQVEKKREKTDIFFCCFMAEFSENLFLKEVLQFESQIHNQLKRESAQQSQPIGCDLSHSDLDQLKSKNIHFSMKRLDLRQKSMKNKGKIRNSHQNLSQFHARSQSPSIKGENKRENLAQSQFQTKTSAINFVDSFEYKAKKQGLRSKFQCKDKSSFSAANQNKKKSNKLFELFPDCVYQLGNERLNSAYIQLLREDSNCHSLEVKARIVGFLNSVMLGYQFKRYIDTDEQTQILALYQEFIRNQIQALNQIQRRRVLMQKKREQASTKLGKAFRREICRFYTSFTDDLEYYLKNQERDKLKAMEKYNFFDRRSKKDLASRKNIAISRKDIDEKEVEL